MSDQPRHKTSLQRDEEIENDIKTLGFPRPALMVAAMSGENFDRWVNDAFARAQEDKEIAQGKRPPRVEPQPNVAISKWKHDWATASMNNTRNLGPGDTSKK